MPREPDLCCVDANDFQPFTIDVETGWDPPSRRARIPFIADIAALVVGAASGQGSVTPKPVAGEPRWRVVLSDGGTAIAASRWSQDLQRIEALQSEWATRIRQ
jgi:hypothetical protein